MRNLFAALVLLLAACSATDPPTRCTPGAQVTCPCPGGGSGAQVCAASGDGYGTCSCGAADAGGADVVTVGDAPTVDVVAPADRPAPPDVVAVGDAVADVVDASTADVDPRQTPECRAVTQTCDGRTVDVQRGERDGGVTYHCGRCGNTCATGFGCLTCVCIPL